LWHLIWLNTHVVVIYTQTSWVPFRLKKREWDSRCRAAAVATISIGTEELLGAGENQIHMQLH
jgi:hypothetical protein